MNAAGGRGHRAVALVTALTVALSAALVAGSASITSPALAAPAPPSWDDVQAAKGDAAATQRAVDRIVAVVEQLNGELEQQRIAALIAGEQLQQATLAAEQAAQTLAATERRADAARERADASARQAAHLAAQLARAGGGDVTVALVLSGDDADALLYRLGTMSALAGRTDAVLTAAVVDRNQADALTAAAETAAVAHASAVEAAESAAVEAARLATETEQRVAVQQVRLGELATLLAELTGRSAALEREYLESIVPPGSGIPSPQPSAPGPQPSQPAPSPSAPGPQPSQPAPSPSAPAPSPSTPGPSPSPSQPPAPTPPPVTGPQPNAAAVATAIAFARAQLGEPYVFGGAGPDGWDCSGLTMMAYAAAGIAIGGHGATAQYNRASTRGLLVPWAQVQPGDLIFYSTGGSTSASKYHVTIYIGNGQMIEAPYPGVPVRITTARSFDRVPFVARPSG